MKELCKTTAMVIGFIIILIVIADAVVGIAILNAWVIEKYGKSV